MMDLLIQVTTANKINPGGHIVLVRNERGTELQYKPSTPIGKSLHLHSSIIVYRAFFQPLIRTKSVQLTATATRKYRSVLNRKSCF